MIFQAAKGYESLGRVLQSAHDQAAKGKGIKRHSKDGEPFDRQKICEITRRVGLGYPLGQAIKKAEESIVLGGSRGVAEVLGAINYLAAAVIIMEEGIKGEEFERYKEAEQFSQELGENFQRMDCASTMPAPGVMTEQLTRQVEDLGYLRGKQ